MMNTGIEIQNCASRAPRKLGSRWSRTSFSPEKPEARAIQTNSDFIRSLAPEQITRAEAAQPSRPSSAKVTVTEASGETFSGKPARTVLSRKTQGQETNEQT